MFYFNLDSIIIIIIFICIDVQNPHTCHERLNEEGWKEDMCAGVEILREIGFIHACKNFDNRKH